MRGRMPESKKRVKKKHQNGPRRPPRIDPSAPWKPSWWVLWGFITVISELIVISLIRANIMTIKSVQTIVIIVCIPFVVHLLVSGLRKILILSSP